MTDLFGVLSMIVLSLCALGAVLLIVVIFLVAISEFRERR